MTQADDQPEDSTYRGVTIERRYNRSEIDDDGEQVTIYSWVAQTDHRIIIASSLAGMHSAIDSHFDGCG